MPFQEILYEIRRTLVLLGERVGGFPYFQMGPGASLTINFNWSGNTLCVFLSPDMFESIESLVDHVAKEVFEYQKSSSRINSLVPGINGGYVHSYSFTVTNNLVEKDDPE